LFCCVLYVFQNRCDDQSNTQGNTTAMSTNHLGEDTEETDMSTDSEDGLPPPGAIAPGAARRAAMEVSLTRVRQVVMCMFADLPKDERSALHIISSTATG
jgi:hypothetical protein